MGRNLPSFEDADEEYIDMEVSSSSTYFFYSMSSPPHSKEFEFQMSAISIEKEPATSPADELFYKGNLLPLHLPPRLRMVQNLLQISSNTTHDNKTEPFAENTTIIASTPFQSCNISPAASCRVSIELNPDENFFDCLTEVRSCVSDNVPKKSWSRTLKLIKQSSLGLKLKASRAYFKSLFKKSGSSDQACAEAAKKRDEGIESNAKECLNKHMKMTKKNSFEQIESERYQIRGTVMRGTEKENIESCGSSSHRKSFSGAMKKHSPTKSSSFSSSSSVSSSSYSSSSSLSIGNSNEFYEIHLLKRSSSVNSEIESSIQGAIAHCKQSQKLFCTRKTVSEVEFCSLSASRIAASKNQEWPGLCRG